VIAYDFVPVSSKSLDELQAEVIVLPFFSDERPLCGASGLIDWRLCGALSRKLIAGYLDGRFGEKGFVAAPAKLKSDALLLFGLGQSMAFDRTIAEEASREIAEALSNARVSTAAIALPGRSMELLSAIEAMQLWLGTSPGDALEEVTVVERPEEHRALASLVDGLRRQAESPLD
jgi:hypothetical protein